jgi:hypothetical protein
MSKNQIIFKENTMNIRFMSLAAAFTTSAATLCMDGAPSPAASSTPPALPVASIVAAMSKPSSPMVRLCTDNLTAAHASAYVTWPDGISLGTQAGECAMIVQTNIQPGDFDSFNLLTVPQQIVNGIPEEIGGLNWPGHDESEKFKSMMAGMIVQINRKLVVEASSSSYSYILRDTKQRICGLALAFGYSGKTYRAQAKLNPNSDQLVPFISTDHIVEDTAPVALLITRDGTPIAQRAVSGL